VLWSHGTPNIGEPPAPLFAAAAELGIRLFGYDRPGYGPSTRVPDRRIGGAAEDAAAVADALGIDTFALMGHSGGGPHVLACAALMPERVTAVVAMSGLAPYPARESGLDFFAGMTPGGAAELRAAAEGRQALERRLARDEYDPEMFTPKDHETLEGEWSWIARIAGKALDGGIEGMVDDDLAYVKPWGFEPGEVKLRTLIVHGDQDRVVPVAHARWLAARLPAAELRIAPGDGHVSVLPTAARAALEWLVQAAG
jgi:pimeloyl-ACP methyl ester carboxylesterase